MEGEEVLANPEASEILPNELLVQHLAEDYAQYLKIDTTKEHHQFDESIEEMLTKLDEYCGLVDMIRSDTSLCLTKTLPVINAKSKEMEAVFERIDQLEAFVAVVRDQVALAEEHVSQAEDQMGSLSSIKKMFSALPVPSFMSPKRTPAKVDSKPYRYNHPEIYKTEDYLKKAPTSSSTDHQGAKETSSTESSAAKS